MVLSHRRSPEKEGSQVGTSTADVWSETWLKSCVLEIDVVQRGARRFFPLHANVQPCASLSLYSVFSKKKNALTRTRERNFL